MKRFEINFFRWKRNKMRIQIAKEKNHHSLGFGHLFENNLPHRKIYG